MEQAPPTPRHSNLPVELTSFVGREAELVELGRLLEQTRVLTLTGPGGIGKTRLARRAARQVAAAFPDGIWLVELAALSDPAQVAQAVVHAARSDERYAALAPENLAEQLRPCALLLVLDNCEHLLDGVARLAVTLLEACPRLRLLCTSRQSLGVPGEVAWRVPSLPLPHPLEQSPERLVSSGAAALFAERATAAAPGFTLSVENTPAVARICTRLDGLPLAVELAAARVRVLSVEQIASRLEASFQLLTSTARGVPARQQTLRATLDWSYQLLTEPERLLFRRLAVFSGGWTVEAAEAVCADTSLPTEVVLDTLDHLLDKSLIAPARDQHGAARYRFLEPIRAYALELEAESGEDAVLRARHLAWMLDSTRQAGDTWRRDQQSAWLDYMDGELENVRAALRWCRETSEVEAGLRLVDAAWFYWNVRGHVAEWRQWVESLLRLPAAERLPVSVHVTALIAAGYLAQMQSDVAASRALNTEGLARARAGGDAVLVARALRRLGLDALTVDDARGAIPLLEESVATSSLVDAGDARLARYSLGQAYRQNGQLEQAGQVLETVLAEMRAAGDQWHGAHTLIALGHVAALGGNCERATDHLLAALDVFSTLGDRRTVAGVLDGLALVACEQGHPERAARLLGAADAQRQAIGATPDPFLRADHERVLARVRAALPAALFRAAFEDGAGLSLEDGLALARAQTSAAPGAALTPREREVAALAAQGLSNRQIADALVISELTAETHVKHILSKLGLRSRAQIASVALPAGRP